MEKMELGATNYFFNSWEYVGVGYCNTIELVIVDN